MLPGSPIPIKGHREIQQEQKQKAGKNMPQNPWEQPAAKNCKFSRAKAWELYRENKSDKQIAAELGCETSSITKWRRYYKLTTVKKQGKENGTE